MPDLTELRDELARVCGWHVPDMADPYWEKDGRVEHHSWHPFPTNDLNALHVVIPKDAIYTLSRTAEGTCEMHSAWPVPHVGEPVTSEYEAIGRWLLAVLKEKAHA